MPRKPSAFSQLGLKSNNLSARLSKIAYQRHRSVISPKEMAMIHQACQSSATPKANGDYDLHSRLNAMRSEIDLIQSRLATFITPEMNTAREVIRARAMRRDFFETDLFADPAWDILLELYACSLAQQRVPVSKLVFYVEVPATTVLRWISLLVKRGLAVRHPDPTDRRRTWVSLSSLGLQKMEAYFAALQRPWP